MSVLMRKAATALLSFIVTAMEASGTWDTRSACADFRFVESGTVVMPSMHDQVAAL